MFWSEESRIGECFCLRAAHRRRSEGGLVGGVWLAGGGGEEEGGGQVAYGTPGSISIYVNVIAEEDGTLWTSAFP